MISEFKSESAMDVDAPASLDETVVVEPSSVDIPVPPGHWRVGEPHPKAKALLLRFATKDDRKIRGAEKRSHYYQKYGNPNYGGMTGLISQSRKRKMMAAKNRQVVDKLMEDSNDNDEYNSGEILKRPVAKAIRTKLPRMRMYADEEEKKAKGGGVRKTDFQPKSGNIRSRLGTKYTKEDLIHLGKKFSSDSESEEEDNVEINCTVPSRFNIWTDLAKSMAKEDTVKPRTDYSSDLESDLDLYRNLRSATFEDTRKDSRPTFQDCGKDLRSTFLDTRKDLRSTFHDTRKDSRSTIQDSWKDSRAAFQESRNFKRSREPRTRDDRTSRNRGDLRSALSSHSRSRDISPDGSGGDLRSKIRRLKRDDSDTRKYRSPLCKDD